jgi:hypothetical protein
VISGDGDGMAIEFDWAGDANVDTPTLRDFVATAIAGRQHPDGTVFVDGMSITARAVSGDDVNPTIALFGFVQRFRARFRFANLAEEWTAEHNTALMVQVLITFTRRHGGSGVLLFNGDENVLQYDPDGVVFSSDWEDWTENGEVAPLLARFASRVLPQPLL